ncbi:MAG: MBL fold metallo-hydrolase [Aestuariivirga sp.]
MILTATILGCGSSGGVPRIGGDWGACDPANPKNRRRRCSLLLRQRGDNGETTVLIDTSPDLREQMLTEGIGHLDAVLYTHEHADHTHGIDELRAFYLRQRRRVPLCADAVTGQMLVSRFGYCFSSPAGSDYPPIATLHMLAAQHETTVDGAGGPLRALPFRVHHGQTDAFGFRIGALAYTPDINGVPEESLKALENLDLWIVDALRRNRHPSHFSLAETLEWIEQLKPRRAIVTNMHVDLDFDTLAAELPPNVSPAYDGLTVEISQ